MQQPNLTAGNREKSQMALIEAALYVTGRPLDMQTLGSVSGIRSEEKIRLLARTLVEKYRKVDGSIEIVELEDGRYVMQLRPEYSKSVRRLATRQLLPRGALKTLSFIAFKQPVTQAYVVKVRGKLAYGHVKELGEKGLITKDRLGRTKILSTTDIFADYFNLSHNVRLMKRQLQKLFEGLGYAKQEQAITESQNKSNEH